MDNDFLKVFFIAFPTFLQFFPAALLYHTQKRLSIDFTEILFINFRFFVEPFSFFYIYGEIKKEEPAR